MICVYITVSVEKDRNGETSSFDVGKSGFAYETTRGFPEDEEERICELVQKHLDQDIQSLQNRLRALRL